MSQLVLPDLVHSFVLVFQDDILIASKSDDEHPGHVAQVLDRLSQHELWIKPEKCEWSVREVDFLGHHIRATDSGTVIEPMESKVAAVADWPLPTCTSELRSFLGLANFYRDFVQDFSAVAAPLTALTGQRVKFEWNEVHRAAFDQLKSVLCMAPALLAVDDQKPFLLHCDASAFAIGAVLSQHDECAKLRPVIFFSRKLTDTQLRWDIYEREIYSVVAALEQWQMHLKGTSVPVRIFTDHRSLEALAVQLLGPKMARWFAAMSSFNYLVTWIPAEQNSAADALSRRPDHDDGSQHRKLAQTRVAQQMHKVSGNSLGPGVPMSSSELAAVCPTAVQRSVPLAAHDASNSQPELRAIAVSIAPTPLLDRIRNLYAADDQCVAILAEPERHGYYVKDGVIMRHSDQGILVPDDHQLRVDMLHEAHDAPTSGHMGTMKTLVRIRERFYWPGMSRDVAGYVSRCSLCQRNKHPTQKPAGLMKPLPIVGKGEMVTIDFVGELPRSRRGMNCIMVIVDKMTKRAYYEPCCTTIKAKGAAELFFRRVVREQGLPLMIISDRDTRFTSNFWRELWTICGTKLGIATAYHQQTDGQSERQVRTLEESLRSFVNSTGNDWDDRLPHVELAHNSARHASTGFAPLKLHSGVSAVLPLCLQQHCDRVDRATSATQMVDSMARDIELAKSSLKIAQARQKVAYDRRHRAIAYEVGEFAFLATADRIHSKGGKVVWRPLFEGPYRVIDVSEDGLNVTLSMPKSKIHPVFHVSKLKKANMPLNVFPLPQRAMKEVQKGDAVASSSTKLSDNEVDRQQHAVCVTSEHLASEREANLDSNDTQFTDLSDLDGGHDVSQDGIREIVVEHESESDEESDSDDGKEEVSDDVPAPDTMSLRRSGRRHIQPDRLVHSGRLGDQLRLSYAAIVKQSIKGPE